MDHKFTAPFTDTFNTTIGRIDYRPTGNQSLFTRFNIQRDEQSGVPQFPDLRTAAEHRGQDGELGHGDRLGLGGRDEPREHVPIRLHQDRVRPDRHAKAGLNEFRFIDDLNEGFSSNGRETPTHNFVNDMTWLKGDHTVKFGDQPPVHAYPELQQRGVVQPRRRRTDRGSPASAATTSRAAAAARRPGARCCRRSPAASTRRGPTRWINILGVMSQATVNVNYDINGNPLPEGEPVRRGYASDEYEVYVQDSWKLGEKFTVTGGVRYGLASPPYETNGLQVAPNVSLGAWFAQREADDEEGHPGQHPAARLLRAVGPEEREEGLLRLGQEQLRAPARRGLDSDRQTGWSAAGYSLVYDRIGLALAQNFDVNGSYGLSTSIDSQYGGNNETNPAVRFRGITVLPPTVPTRAQGRLPGHARGGPVHHHEQHRRHAEDAVCPHVQRRCRPRAVAELQHGSRLRRASRPQPADPARPRHAAEPDGLEVRHGLLHGGDPGHQAARGQRVRRDEGLAGRLLREPVPRRGIRGDGPRRRTSRRASPTTTPTTCPRCWTSTSSATRTARIYGPYSFFNAQFFSLAGQSTIARSRSTTPCSSRCASASAAATSST